MKKIFYTILALFIVGTLHAQPMDARATVKSAGLTAKAYIKATTAVNFLASNDIQIIISYSLPAGGAINTSTAPTVTSRTSPLGLTVQFFPVFLEDDRFVYTNYITSQTMASQPTWAANTETLVMEVAFSSDANSEFPRLDNRLAGPNGVDYFYFILNAQQRSDTEGDPFYDGSEGTYGAGDLYVEAPTPLPINLISFKAEKFNIKNSLLSWSTASEINSSHFNVQRSLDKKSWSNIGKVNAHGDSQIIRNYEFIDENVYNGSDARLTVYYRLQAVDFDNQMKYSPIETVVFTGVGSDAGREITFYPNPSSDGLQIEWDASRVDQPTSIEFFDVQGNKVYTSKVSDNTNQLYVDYGQTSIIPGLYILRIISGTETIDHKQIIVTSR